MLPFQKTAQCHRMNYIKLAEAHLQHGHGRNYWSSSTNIHLGAYTLVNQLLFSNEMSSDSFFLHLKKLSERTKESFTFLSAFINTELHLLTSGNLQCFRTSCKREHYRLWFTESKATLRFQTAAEGDLGRCLISSSDDLLNQLPVHSKVHWSHTDMPKRLSWGRLAQGKLPWGKLVMLLWALLLFHVGQVPHYLLNVLSNFCSSNSVHAAMAVLPGVSCRLARLKMPLLFLPEPVNLQKQDSRAVTP